MTMTMMVSGLLLGATVFAGCYHNGPVDASGNRSETGPNLDDWRVDRSAKANAGLKGRPVSDVMLNPKGRKGGTEPR
jgi:hypothetical protein